MKKWIIYLNLLSLTILPSGQRQLTYGIIDRFIDDIAIILIEEKNLQFEMNIDELPYTSEEGAIIIFKRIEDEVIAIKQMDEKMKINRNRSEILIEKIHRIKSETSEFK